MHAYPIQPSHNPSSCHWPRSLADLDVWDDNTTTYHALALGGGGEAPAPQRPLWQGLVAACTLILVLCISAIGHSPDGAWLLLPSSALVPGRHVHGPGSPGPAPTASALLALAAGPPSVRPAPASGVARPWPPAPVAGPRARALQPQPPWALRCGAGLRGTRGTEGPRLCVAVQPPPTPPGANRSAGAGAGAGPRGRWKRPEKLLKAARNAGVSKVRYPGGRIEYAYRFPLQKVCDHGPRHGVGEGGGV